MSNDRQAGGAQRSVRFFIFKCPVALFVEAATIQHTPEKGLPQTAHQQEKLTGAAAAPEAAITLYLLTGYLDESTSNLNNKDSVMTRGTAPGEKKPEAIASPKCQ